MQNSGQVNLPRDLWVQLISQADWHQLDYLIGGFHDGIVKEMRWLHGWYVNESLQMVYAANPSLWILIQLQLQDTPSVELRFSNVEESFLNRDAELEASAEVSANKIVLWLSASKTNRIIAESCAYRLPKKALLGEGPFEVPDCFDTTSY